MIRIGATYVFVRLTKKETKFESLLFFIMHYVVSILSKLDFFWKTQFHLAFLGVGWKSVAFSKIFEIFLYDKKCIVQLFLKLVLFQKRVVWGNRISET